jgi:hypothetical protein
MINLKSQVPNIYYDASRDFQVLGHLYEVVLNYVKTNADMLYLLPNGIDTDTRTTELLATTLGFKLRRNYDKDQLAALVSIFPRLLKIKGTIQAVELAGNALVKASGVPGKFAIDKSELENHILAIKIPIELSDITLFMDLLPYILPFGIRVSIIRNTVRTQVNTDPVGINAYARMALPSDQQAVSDYAPHPLGLAKVKVVNDEYSLDYSNSNFIDKKGNAIAGSFGATPIITYIPNEEEHN